MLISNSAAGFRWLKHFRKSALYIGEIFVIEALGKQSSLLLSCKTSVRDFEIHWISRGFRISGFQSGFLDFKRISGFRLNRYYSEDTAIILKVQLEYRVSDRYSDTMHQ